MIKILLLPLMVSAVFGATPNSCYWCISIGKSWDSANNKCASPGYYNVVTAK